MLKVSGIILLGMVAGYFSGLIGLGGGVIIVPALVLIFGIAQPMAQGTTLAMMLPPIGILAVLAYQQKAMIDWRLAGLLCIGFLIGSPLGAKLAIGLPPETLKKVFASVLLLISLKMLLGK